MFGKKRILSISFIIFAFSFNLILLVQESVALDKLPKDMIHELLMKLNPSDWKNLRLINKKFSHVLEMQHLRLSMNLDHLPSDRKDLIKAPQSKRSNHARAVFDIHFYVEDFVRNVSKELMTIRAYAGSETPWREELPSDYSFERVSINESLPVYSRLGAISMIVKPAYSRYETIREKDKPVSCRENVGDISKLEAIKIVAQKDIYREDKGCKILVKLKD